MKIIISIILSLSILSLNSQVKKDSSKPFLAISLGVYYDGYHSRVYTSGDTTIIFGDTLRIIRRLFLEMQKMESAIWERDRQLTLWEIGRPELIGAGKMITPEKMRKEIW